MDATDSIDVPEADATANEIEAADEQNCQEANNRPDFLNDEDSEEDDFVVTIGEIKANVPFQKHHRAGGAIGGTVDLDSNPTFKDGTPIYDLDLATMEDKPWRKPGSDLTDYFNYGFNEETWNQYCERQRKFRQEFGGDQAAINKAILSNIQLSGPALTTFTGGRQLVNLSGGGSQDPNKQPQKIQKIVVDLSKPPPLISGSGAGDSISNLVSNTIPVMRTVINESGIVYKQGSSTDLQASYQMESASTARESDSTPLGTPLTKTPPPAATNILQNMGVIDFSKPPPNFDPAMPPPMPIVSAQQPPMAPLQTTVSLASKTAPITSNIDLPPGVEDMDGPPGVSEILAAMPKMDYSQPPPTSQFSYNPSNAQFGAGSAYGGATGFNIHQHQAQPFGSRPIPLFQPSFRHPFGGYGSRFNDRFRGSRGLGGLSRHDDSGSDSESGHGHRKRRRSRSRSRSPSTSKRYKDEKYKDREHKEKEGKRKKDKEKEKKEKHKSRDRSPSEKKDKEGNRSIKSERRSSEREVTRHRSPSKKKEIKIKIERRSPENVI